MREHFELFDKSGYCPYCASKLEPETYDYYDDGNMHHEGWYKGYTGKYYCPYCDTKYKEQLEKEKEQLEKEKKQKAQKQYEEKVSKYDNEYKYYLEIRELDNLYTLKLTMKEVEALRHLINQNDRFKELDLHHAFKELNHIYLNCDYENKVTPAQRKCIDLIEKNTKHKFYGKTLSSARLFISKYIEESKRG